jgi:hypothetical protein
MADGFLNRRSSIDNRQFFWGGDMPRSVGAAARAKSIYSVHPGVQMVQDWIKSLPQKTGRSLDEWLDLVKKEGPPTEKERREWLKKEYKLGTNSAWWIAERAEAKGRETDDPDRYLEAAAQYVEAMFTGSKAALRPIYDALLKLGLSIGEDVRACPCQTIVPLYRNHVFAQIKPTTQTRIDLGFALKDTKPPKTNAGGNTRLIDTGGFAKKDRITHRIAITKLADINDEVKRWLRTAYDMDA